MKKTNRQLKNEAHRKQRIRSRILLYGGIALAAIAMVVVVLLTVNNPPASSGLMGDAVAIPSRDHVADDTPPGPYNSNPPAGGAHNASDYPAGFYKTGDPETLVKYPAGFLVHSLEHGYVIFWYNCQAPNTDCTVLKQTIQKVMDETGGTKLIAFPWSDMSVPLAMTSWGRILNFTTPDPALMKQFVERNRYQAPEPDAP